jgi:hypothetical protein
MVRTHCLLLTLLYVWVGRDIQSFLHFAGKLELHEADLLKEGSFDAAVKGAHFVFHTASPFFRCAHGSARCQQQQHGHLAGLEAAAWLACCWLLGSSDRGGLTA